MIRPLQGELLAGLQDRTASDSLRGRIWIERRDVSAVQPMIERWHYSRSTFGVTPEVCFMVYLDASPEGAAIFGPPAGMGVAEKYSGGKRLTELRRFVMSDAAPRNSESCALGKMFRVMRSLGFGRILSYSDPHFGHEGTIYKATGFAYLGQTDRRRHWRWKGKVYPDRNLHQTAFAYHEQLRRAVASGEAEPVDIPGKHIFIKEL